jgi:hypothetical protein
MGGDEEYQGQSAKVLGAFRLTTVTDRSQP